MIKLNVTEFILKVYGNITIVTVVATFIPYFVNKEMEEGFIRFSLISVLALITTLASEFFVGCNKEERKLVNGKIVSIIQNKLHK